MVKHKHVLPLEAPLVIVQRNGMITIPKQYREMLGIKTRDYVSFEMTKEGIFIRPHRIVGPKLEDLM